jgi:spoIIIJ-associated protein
MIMTEGEQNSATFDGSEPIVREGSAPDSAGAQDGPAENGFEPGIDQEKDDSGALGRNRSRRRRNGGNDERNDYRDDERAKLALDFVTAVIEDMDMDCRVRLRRPRQETPDEAPEIVVEVTGRDSGRIIGKKGLVLGALQFLTHRVINRPGQDRRHVLVDADGYRLRREQSLATMAKRLGKQALEEGKIITFEPMNPRDRRVVHLALAKFEGVITKSDGEGDSRRVQIIPVRRS